MSNLLLKPDKGYSATGEILAVTPEGAGWDSISLRLIRLHQGQRHVHAKPEEELVLVSLAGRVTVTADGSKWEGIGGRKDVFSGMPHA
ncbi:MAG: 5-deoxy-glucuronate isomerase, partial [bacterium]|nr:5-deoxy-glucuronate isomerase [bacterium]